MTAPNDIRHGRHCVFQLLAHLVFVARRRGEVFTGQHLADLEAIFASVCADFGAQLLNLAGGPDYVHLQVSYPPKVALAALVNSLKGVSSRRLRTLHPQILDLYWEGKLWSPSYGAISNAPGRPVPDAVSRFIAEQA